MKKIFLILGMSGSGKTTVSKIIEQSNEKIEHYSMGDKFREVAQQDINLAKYVFSGKRVPLEMAKKVITNVLNNIQKDIVIIDGYPRDIEQMIFFDSLIEKDKNLSLVNVFELEIDENISRNRVLTRFRGADDNEEVFNNRLKDYKYHMIKIRENYQHLLITINGNDLSENISKKIIKRISET